MLRQRILTAIVAVALLFLVLFALPAVAARTVIVAVILMAAWEWAAFLGRDEPLPRLMYVAVVAAALGAMHYAVGAGVVASDTVLLAALAAWAAALAWLFFYPTPVPRLLAWVAGLVVLLPAWLALDIVYSMRPALLLFMLILVFGADVGAYFAGKQFGRVKLAPAVSPGKTWEGVIGGLMLVGVLSVVGAWWFAVPAATLLPFAIALGLTSVVGDLTVSVFKRNAGIKDSGSLFPGHGGLLDRIDSITAAAPLFALGAGWAGL